jgi:hypothetical protein
MTADDYPSPGGDLSTGTSKASTGRVPTCTGCGLGILLDYMPCPRCGTKPGRVESPCRCEWVEGFGVDATACRADQHRDFSGQVSSS